MRNSVGIIILMASELINTHSQQKTTGMNPPGVKSYFATFLEDVSEPETRVTFFNVTPSVLSPPPPPDLIILLCPVAS